MSFSPAAGTRARAAVEPTYLAADTAAMAKKPESPKPTTWTIYKLAARQVWLGL